MLHDFDSLANLVSELIYSEGIDSDSISANRVGILQKFLSIEPNSRLQVWLAENDTAPQLRLAYVLPFAEQTDHPFTDTIVPLKWDSTSRSLDAETAHRLEKAAQKTFLRLDIQRFNMVSTALFKKIPEKERQAQEHATGGILGWLSLNLPRRGGLNPSETVAFQTLAAFFSLILEHSRVRRIIAASEQCAQVLHNAKDPLDAMKGAGNVLQDLVSAERVHLFCVVGGELEAAENSQKAAVVAAHSKLFSELRTRIMNKLRSARVEQAPDSVNGINAESLLGVPITMRGRLLTKHFPFTPIDAVKDEFTATNGTPYCLILENKQSPQYLAKSFSDTDLRISDAVARQLTNYVPGRLFELKFSEITRMFENFPLTRTLGAGVCNSFWRARSPLVAEIKLLIFDCDGETMRPSAESEFGSRPLPREVLDMIKDYGLQFYETTARGFPDFLRVAVEPGIQGSSYLVFHLCTVQIPFRFFLVELRDIYIDEPSFEVFCFFFKEAHMMLRNQDSMRERLSTLAQIRHAVRGPLSAATEFVRAYQRTVELMGRTDEGWSSLRKDPLIREGLPKVHYLNTQALNFAETGRYLLSQMSSKDLKVDYYDPVVLIKEVKLAFDSEITRRELQWTFVVEGLASRTMTGDKLLIWILLYNLIDNAVKYAHRKTIVEVKVVLRDTGWRFEVKDAGVYLSPGEKARVFQPFVRSRGDDKLNRRPGTGLGLPVCHMIVRSHGSDVLDYHSVRGATTTFWFELPSRVGAS